MKGKWLFGVLSIWVFLATGASAHTGYQYTVPNGDRYGCGLCHYASQGGGDLNGFGADYKRIAIPAGGTVFPTWTRDLAKIDSDGDGYTNGEELQEITANPLNWRPEKIGSGEDEWNVSSGVRSFVRHPGDPSLSVPSVRFDRIRPTEYEVNVDENITIPLLGQPTVPGRSATFRLLGRAAELEGLKIMVLSSIEERGIEKTTAQLTWTPAELQGGPHTIGIELSDGTSAEVQTIKITVLGGIIVEPDPGENPEPERPVVRITDFTASHFDFDKSLIVDIADFTTFASFFGKSRTQAGIYDFDKSGWVDWRDFLFFAFFFNKKAVQEIQYRTPANDALTFVPVEGGSFVQYVEADSTFRRFTILAHEMGKTEISNRQYRNFLVRKNNVLALTPWPFDGKIFETRAQELPDHPVVGVSWDMADAYCKWAGGRLPTAAEWNFAARGTQLRRYAHGDLLAADRANYLNSGDPFEPGTTPVGFYSGRLFQDFQTTDTFSLYGAYDMTGNVWEWCADVRGNEAPIKGGSYLESGLSDDLTVNAERWLQLTDKRENVGFRCLREK